MAGMGEMPTICRTGRNIQRRRNRGDTGCSQFYGSARPTGEDPFASRRTRIFDAVRSAVAETDGARETRRALDSVVLDETVAIQDTVTQPVAAIRRVRRAAPAAAAVIAAECHAHDYGDRSRGMSPWPRGALVSASVGDAIRIVHAQRRRYRRRRRCRRLVDGQTAKPDEIPPAHRVHDR
ncbi:hypothetical protein IU479_35570 [Nocardia abscessus]|uniref:hypothetical protein n=1 Tax=Nocardia abscessus TaxID=120957 RepID=UPI0018954B83|nr:hypothetical protein [Nocardia abscessus]